MRVKLTAKHPRAASSERAPVRTGSTSARKPTRPAGPKPSPSTAGFSGARGEGAGKAAGGGKRPAGGKAAGGGARAPRAEGSFSRERDAGGARRTTSERPPRREGAGSASRRVEGGGERAPRRADGERGQGAPRRFEGAGDRGERAPRRFEGTGDRGEKAPRRFEGTADRGDRAPRSFEGNRAPRRDEGERRSFSGPRPAAGRPSEGGPRGERPVRREHEGADRPRFGSDRGASQERRSGERGPRSDSATPRHFDGERGSSQRGERSFAKPVKSGYGDRADRPARAPRDDRGERAPAKREFGDRPARTGERSERTERGERPARSFDKTLPVASRRFGDDRPARTGKPRGAAPAARVERNHGVDAAPRTPRRDYEDAPGTLRLSKLMSELGLCSRREADEWIEKGWVLVDGERIDTLGTKVRPDQRIEIDPAAEAAQASQVTVLVHKTVGFVSGQAEDGYQPAITLVTPENRWEGDRSAIRFSVAHLRQLAPAGRLDIDSTGLLVLTQDGRIAKQLIGGHSEIDKEYLVRVSYGEHTTEVESHFPPESLALLRHGLSLDDVPLKPAQVSWQNGEQLRFVLREGMKRQIRRMCELVGLEVVGLKRVRMGRVTLGALPPGQWRYLSPDESF